jgi:hypothetical protein
VGRPLLVQGMRYEGHSWDPKGPASIHRARATLDRNGSVIGYVFESKGFSRIDIDTNETNPAYSLAGQLMDLPLKSLEGFGVSAESYDFASGGRPAARQRGLPMPRIRLVLPLANYALGRSAHGPLSTVRLMLFFDDR